MTTLKQSAVDLQATTNNEVTFPQNFLEIC